MSSENRTGARAVWVLGSVFILAASVPASAQHAGAHAGGGAGSAGRMAAPAPHQHLDSRYSHNQYYYNRGYPVHRPPPGGVGELRGRDGGRYWNYHGNWYRWRGGWYRWWGGAWVVWAAPIGLLVPVLPPYFTTVWWDGIPYYYANDTYYVWNGDQQQYEVVPPPAGIESGGTTEAPPSNELYVYPKSGQSSEQQARDRYECHRWAVEQSGYDPTAAGSGAATQETFEKRNDYFRADTTCLEGRGYAVK